ncbi:Na+/H+ antiporter [Streptomyces sp. JV176]|uniref:Na+/H+ antiporter n=1 Tax=Streptomyces sp. JV176 TaxID=858630 RepID=UPI002E7A6DAE|nr:Na+/H+ antiporter [Streptomyces sp. JV176]MEE1799366.1 Na+/H+ antiporter [Streptomyces sp. JV176]
MAGLELVVILACALLVSGVLAHRLRVAAPVLQLAAGILLGFVPALRGTELPPDILLLVFLPVILYWESVTTSLRTIRRDLRGIVLTGTLLVACTAWAVAALAHALGLPWGPAWVLGAAVAPTDATAVGVVSRLLPHRNITLLRAESLINDGTALVVYGLAVGVTVGSEHLTTTHISALVALSYGGGIAVGVAVAWLGVRVRRRVSALGDALLDNLTILLIPFTAYLLAEFIEASGVLAVVVCGLIMSQAGPSLGRAAARRQTEAFWSLAMYLLNGALFVLVGLEAQAAVRGLSGTALPQALLMVVAVYGALVAVRFLFLFVSVYAIRALDRRPQQRKRRMSHRARVVSALAGFRGAVSLALALSVPYTVGSGAPFPDRDAIVFVTAGVVVATLVVQGLVLPAVTRRAGLPRDTDTERELGLARTTASEAALDALPAVAADLGTDAEVAERLRAEYETHLRTLNATGAADAPGSEALVRRHQQETALRLALLEHKRSAVIGLRDRHRIDDAVLLRVQGQLDAEEARLAQIMAPE